MSLKLFCSPGDNGSIKELLSKMELASLLTYPVVDDDMIARVCDEAVKYQFASVCALPNNVEAVMARLKGSGVKTVYCIGESSGYGDPMVSILAGSEAALKKGVDELLIPINLSKLLDGDYDRVISELKQQVGLAAKYDAVFTLSLEAHTLSDEEALKVTDLAIEAGVQYIKTATGIAPDDGRATFHHLGLIMGAYKGRIKLKAGGGTKYSFLEDSQALLDCGACSVDAGDMVVAQLKEIEYYGGIE